MAIDRNLIEVTRDTDEYRKGVEFLGDPDDYATATMTQFIGFYIVMTAQQNGNIDELNRFIRQLGVTAEVIDTKMLIKYEDEDALVTAFTYIVGRNSKEYFDTFLDFLRKQKSGEI